MEDSPIYSSYSGDIYIRVKEPLYGVYKEIFVRRVQYFFDKWAKKNGCPSDLKLKSAKLIEMEKGIFVEGYVCRNLSYEKPMNIIEACNYLKENPSKRIKRFDSDDEYCLNESGQLVLIGKCSSEMVEIMDVFNSMFFKSFSDDEEQIFLVLEDGTLLTSNRARMRVSLKSCYDELEFAIRKSEKVNRPVIYCGRKISQSNDSILLANVSIVPGSIINDAISKIPYELEREKCNLNLGLADYDVAFKYFKFVISSPAASSYYPFVCANNTCYEERMEWLKEHSNFSVRIYDINKTYSHGKLFLEKKESNCYFDYAVNLEEKYDRNKFIIVYIPYEVELNFDLEAIIPYAASNYLDDIQQKFEDDMDSIHDKIGTICEVRDIIL